MKLLDKLFRRTVIGVAESVLTDLIGKNLRLAAVATALKDAKVGDKVIIGRKVARAEIEGRNCNIHLIAEIVE